jgi:hypothetical protein
MRDKQIPPCFAALAFRNGKKLRLGARLGVCFLGEGIPPSLRSDPDDGKGLGGESRARGAEQVRTDKRERATGN